MKKLLVIMALGMMATSTIAAETKQICSDVKDRAGNVVLNKDGTARQTCRTIKIHEKYEGTVVPTKPAAKPATTANTTAGRPAGFDPAVEKRQRELIAVGARITADGITGPGTRRAEAEFGHLAPKK
jgi:hypothetical protein